MFSAVFWFLCRDSGHSPRELGWLLQPPPPEFPRCGRANSHLQPSGVLCNTSALQRLRAGVWIDLGMPLGKLRVSLLPLRSPRAARPRGCSPARRLQGAPPHRERPARARNVRELRSRRNPGVRAAPRSRDRCAREGRPHPKPPRSANELVSASSVLSLFVSGFGNASPAS